MTPARKAEVVWEKGSRWLLQSNRIFQSTFRAFFAIYESPKVLKGLLLRTIYLKTGYHFSDYALVKPARAQSKRDGIHPRLPDNFRYCPL